MLRPAYIMEAFTCLSIAANWSILSVAQYRHAERYLLIKEWMLIHQNSGELEKCQKSLFWILGKKQYFHSKFVTLRSIDLGLVLTIRVYRVLFMDKI
jgi:hypothetical protein